MKAVIDSDILIDYLQGKSAAAKEIASYDEPCYSIITWMEIMCGAQDEPQREAARFLLDSMRLVELSRQIAEHAVVVRQQKKLKLPDAIIHASAEAEGCILVTRNTKDFDRRDPRIRIPYKV